MYFSPETMLFLKELRDNNNREWFQANKQRYEECVRTPALNLIEDTGPLLRQISPNFTAIPKKVGGSLMRIYRDARFSRDKTPYKLNIGIQFRHAMGRDVHAPGYYLHIQPGLCFIGAGIWRPDSKALGKIRERIDRQPECWLAVRDDREFNAHYKLIGESLKNPPRGYTREHPLLKDLKRKDLIADHELEDTEIFFRDLPDQIAGTFARSTSFMAFLCDALEIPF
ncbi:MAG: DUF2461 domain-containing protein [Pseudomonadota bacterium]|nr:DUF2461 domain-containing protein [Pseudomonadota bacterium]